MWCACMFGSVHGLRLLPCVLVYDPRSDLQRSASSVFVFVQVMDDVGNQTSCRLAGLRPGTVYFVQVWIVVSTGTFTCTQYSVFCPYSEKDDILSSCLHVCEKGIFH